LADVAVAASDEVRATIGEVEPERVTVALVKAGVAVRGLAVSRPALEDLFVELTGEGFDVAR
jgi:ABC-2 type transport system ATP-binding protein